MRSLSDGAKSNKTDRRQQHRDRNKSKFLTLSLSVSEPQVNKCAGRKMSSRKSPLGKARSEDNCSCGCENSEAVTSSPDLISASDLSDVDVENEVEEIDEGCYILQTRIIKEIVRSASSAEKSTPSSSPTSNEVTSIEKQVIYIDSVDSGRSSDSGTHQSWGTTSSSTSSASSGGPASPTTATSSTKSNGSGVQIVPHNFCDYLGSIKRPPPAQTTGSEGHVAASKPEMEVYASLGRGQNTEVRRKQHMRRVIVQRQMASSNKVKQSCRKICWHELIFCMVFSGYRLRSI